MERLPWNTACAAYRRSSSLTLTEWSGASTWVRCRRTCCAASLMSCCWKRRRRAARPYWSRAGCYNPAHWRPKHDHAGRQRSRGRCAGSAGNGLGRHVGPRRSHRPAGDHPVAGSGVEPARRVAGGAGSHAAGGLLQTAKEWAGDRTIAGAGIALAGSIDAASNMLLSSPNLPALNGVTLPTLVGADAGSAGVGGQRRQPGGPGRILLRGGSAGAAAGHSVPHAGVHNLQHRRGSGHCRPGRGVHRRGWSGWRSRAHDRRPAGRRSGSAPAATAAAWRPWHQAPPSPARPGPAWEMPLPGRRCNGPTRPMRR